MHVRRLAFAAAVIGALGVLAPSPARAQVVMLELGVTFWPQVRVSYGVDLRGDWQNSVFARLEGFGASSARVTAGVAVTSQPFSGELGIALHSPQLGTDIGTALSLHLGAGITESRDFALMFHGSFPMVGDGRNAYVGVYARPTLLDYTRYYAVE